MGADDSSMDNKIVPVPGRAYYEIIPSGGFRVFDCAHEDLGRVEWEMSAQRVVDECNNPTAPQPAPLQPRWGT